MVKAMQSWVRDTLESTASGKSEVSRRFPFDLSGWKYVRGEEREATKTLRQVSPRGVLVTIQFKSHRFAVAEWKDDEWEMHLYAGASFDPSSDWAESTIDTLVQFTRHEAQHMGQDMLRVIRGLSEKAGLPSRGIRTPEYRNPEGTFFGPADPHALIDEEYQTRLADSVAAFLRETRRMDDDGKAQVARSWVRGRDPFFAMLRNFAPGKWRDAVGKFTVELARKGITVAPKRRR